MLKLKFLSLLGLLGAVVLLALVGLPDMTRPEFGFAFLIAVACATNWLLKKAPGHYKSPRCRSCGRNPHS